MARHIVNLSERAEDQTQEFIAQVRLPDFTLHGAAHGQVRLTVNLAPPTGGIMLELDVRDERNRMVHRLRYGFSPGELVHNPETRRIRGPR